MNVYEVCSKIKKSIKTSIIILTARDDIDYEFHTLNIEVDNYMIKPFKFNKLLALINAPYLFEYTPKNIKSYLCLNLI